MAHAKNIGEPFMAHAKNLYNIPCNAIHWILDYKLLLLLLELMGLHMKTLKEGFKWGRLVQRKGYDVPQKYREAGLIDILFMYLYIFSLILIPVWIL